MNKKIINSILIILGSILLSIFIYINFIREKLPRDIPIILSETRFYILLFLCCTYLYAIKQILYPKKPNNILIKIAHYISKPFIFFNSFIKYNKFIYPHYLKLFNYITNILDIFNRPECALFIYTFQLIPRILLLLIFMTDIFYVQKIEIFYYFILLGLFPLIYRYIIYSLEFALEQFIIFLETLYDDVWLYEKDNYNVEDSDIINDTNDNYIPKKNAIYHDKYLSIREYISIQVETNLNYDLGKEETQFEYVGHPTVKKNVLEDYKKTQNKLEDNLTDEDYDDLTKSFYQWMPNLIDLAIFLKILKYTQNFCYIPKTKGFIYFGYFICWFYILFVSAQTINNYDITWNILKLFLEHYETTNPFTDITLEDYMHDDHML